QLGRVLVEVSARRAVPALHGSRERLHPPGQDLQERRLPGAVPSHDPDAVAARDAQVRAREQRLFALVAAGELARLDHELASALGFRRADHGAPNVVVGPRETDEVLQLLLASLRLRGPLASHVLPDERLFLPDEVLLLLPRALLGEETQLLLLEV